MKICVNDAKCTRDSEGMEIDGRGVWGRVDEGRREAQITGLNLVSMEMTFSYS